MRSETTLLRAAAMAVLMFVPACAGVTSAGRNAAPAPAPPVAPAPAAPARAPQPAAPPVAAPGVAVPTPAPRPSAARGDDIVVPGQARRQIPPPDGDPRSMAERRQDVRAWDECVSEAQAAYESDPMRPQMQSPEEACRGSLGMVDRDSVPQSRRRR